LSSLAELFRIERFLVPRGMINTAVKEVPGKCSRIVSKEVLLSYASEKPSILGPGAD
jgi:hypothetical protein